MRGLYVVVGVIMAGVSSVFALLAELEDRYDLPTASLGWIAGSAFAGRPGHPADAGPLRRPRLRPLAAAPRRVASRRRAAVVRPGHRAVAVRGGPDPARRRRRHDHAAGPSGHRADVDRQPGRAPRHPLRRLPVRLRVRPAHRGSADHGRPTSGCRSSSSDWWRRPRWCGSAGIEMPEARSPGRRRWPGPTERVLRRLLVDRRVIAAILVIVSFRYSIGVFEPLWATYLDDRGASTIVITLSLTGFALPMLIFAKSAGRMSDRYGPRVGVGVVGPGDGADHGRLRLRPVAPGDHRDGHPRTACWRRSSPLAARPPSPTPPPTPTPPPPRAWARPPARPRPPSAPSPPRPSSPRWGRARPG